MLEQLSLPGLRPKPAETHKLFFAVVPEAAAAERTVRLARYLQDTLGLHCKLMEPDRLHVSLLGVGTCRHPWPELIAPLRKAAATASMAPFDIVFDRVVSFQGRPGNVPLVLLESGGDSALAALRRALAAALASAGIDPRARSSFTPHVTLLYGERMVAQQAIEPISWPVRDFVLVDSVHGQHRHVPLDRWPLQS